eukprot:TRINITY_DN43579_c0_g1_i1.p1 TRINITY_DN43579_c0_g1~~TRINITY_DN43579_c0_g1_i1.p1  ORF type:complete len:354 (+),score=74.07 TRINITY_DN43579_c0_g1_i1:65-1126(+)
MASKPELVQQIKDLQRSNPDVKQAWWDFCEQELGGIKDPARHDANALEDFLSSVNGGSAAPAARRPSAPSRGSAPPASGGRWVPGNGLPASRGTVPSRQPVGAAVGGGRPAYGGASLGGMQMMPMMHAMAAAQAAPAPAPAGAGNLVEFIKVGQRASPRWKEGWSKYCEAYGTGKFDPSKYDDSFIATFIDWAGQLAEANLEQVTGGLPPAASRGPPPRTASRAPAMSAAPRAQASRAAPSASPSGPALGGGSGRWVPGPAAGKGAPAVPVKRSRQEPFDAFGAAPAKKARPSAGDDDPERSELVQLVKGMQRTPEGKQAWSDFALDRLNNVRDPARHDADTLREFLELAGEL